MKYLLLTLLLTSCAYSKYPVKRNSNSNLSHTDKMEACVFRLIERNGVSSVNARETCEKIYRRN